METVKNTGATRRSQAQQVDDQGGIESAALPRYRTARTYVLLAHLYVLTSPDEREDQTATVSDILMPACSMVKGAAFRRLVTLRLNEACATGLATTVHPCDGAAARFALTLDGLMFLRRGHKRRLGFQRRHPHLLAEHICTLCDVDELQDWKDAMKEVRTRCQFSRDVCAREFSDRIIRGIQDKLRLATLDIAPVWAGLVLRELA